MTEQAKQEQQRSIQCTLLTITSGKQTISSQLLHVYEPNQNETETISTRKCPTTAIREVSTAHNPPVEK